MSDYVDRLERELLSAGRNSYQRRVAGRRTRGTTFALLGSAMVTAAVIAVIILTGVLSTASHSARPTDPGRLPTVRGPRLGGPTTTRAVGACRTGKATKGVSPPPLRYSSASPSGALLHELAVLRSSTYAAQLRRSTFNPSPWDAIRVYTRYVRAVSAPADSQIVLIPAIVCALPISNLQGVQAFAPHEVLLMQVLGPKFANNGRHPGTILVGSAQQIAHQPVLPGLDADNRAWMQTTVVPDGVARVEMHFTPPFRPFYTRTLAVHNNVAAAFPLPAYTPTTTTWYDAAGHVVHRFVDHTALRYETCLRHHRKNCSD
jgi:hypothetical protein